MVPEFGPQVAPFLRSHGRFSGELSLVSFTEGDLIWACSQEKGIPPLSHQIADWAIFLRLLSRPAPISAPIPLPRGRPPIGWVATAEVAAVRYRRKEQLAALPRVFDGAAAAKTARFSYHPPGLARGSGALLISGFASAPTQLRPMGVTAGLASLFPVSLRLGRSLRRGSPPISDKSPSRPRYRQFGAPQLIGLRRVRASGLRLAQELWGVAMG